MKSYDYANREGVRALTWEDVARLSAGLAEALEPMGIDVVIGIARAGLIPATIVASSLRRELYPVRVTRRVDDVVLFESPVWRVPVSEDVAGKRVVVIDEIADSGDTLALVARSVLEEGAVDVITACLVQHTWADPVPDHSALVTDEFVIFPWDEKVLVGGEWQPHPEIEEGLAAQEQRARAEVGGQG